LKRTKGDILNDAKGEGRAFLGPGDPCPAGRREEGVRGRKSWKERPEYSRERKGVRTCLLTSRILQKEKEGGKKLYSNYRGGEEKTSSILIKKGREYVRQTRERRKGSEGRKKELLLLLKKETSATRVPDPTTGKGEERKGDYC